MATEYLGGSFVLQSGGTVIGGRKGGAVNFKNETLDVTDAGGAWKEYVSGARDWEVPLDGSYIVGGEKITGCPSVQIAPDGGTLYQVNTIKKATLNLSADTVSVANCSASGFKKKLMNSRKAELQLEFDMDSSAPFLAAYTLWKAVYLAGGKFDIALGFGGNTYTGKGIVTEWNTSMSGEEVSAASVKFDISGALTRGGASVDTGLDTLLSAFFASPMTPITFTTVNANASVHDFTGQTYLTAFSVSGGFGELTSFSGTLSGAGALTVAV